MTEPEATGPPTTLRKAASTVLNSPIISLGLATTSVERRKTGGKSKLTAHDSRQEIIPDSEEERIAARESESAGAKENVRAPLRVIEISSDEEETPAWVASANKGDTGGDPFLDEFALPGAWPRGNASTFDANPNKGNGATVGWTPRTPRAISRPEKEPGRSQTRERPIYVDPDVIELTDSSPELPPMRYRSSKGKGKGKAVDLSASRTNSEETPTSSTAAEDAPQPLYYDDPSEDDGAILTLNEPKSARRPRRLDGAPALSTPKKRGLTRTADRTPIGTPSQPRHPSLDNRHLDVSVPSTPTKSTPVKSKPTPARKMSKKALAELEHARRAAYAQELFNELNLTVFKSGLPETTELVWNNRLLTTAGQAKWHRSHDGVETAKIQLADKILDCDERIRNTLAHEMCHLASWIIDQDLSEGHGKLFKTWAARVMRKRPEIEVTTKHNYEISYPFQWECISCAKIYGRFSKSIDPAVVGCGSCRGTLRPLGSVPERIIPKSKGKKTSRMAAVSPRAAVLPGVTTVSGDADDSEQDGCYESDSDVEILTMALGGVAL